MVEIIPAILTDSPEEFGRLAQLLAGAGVTRAHLDICDGQFVETRTIDGYEELTHFYSPIKWGVHLMVADPEAALKEWSGVPNADRFIVHIESGHDLGLLTDRCHNLNCQLWAAINPETAVDKLEAIKDKIDGVVFMTVHPGRQGNPFVPEVLEKVKTFKAQNPNIKLSVDGGINPKTAAECISAGADVLVSGSYIMKSDNIKEAIEKLQNV